MSAASAADWLTAWATVGYTVAAIVAGIFAWRAWTATKRSLDTAQESLRTAQEGLRIEQDRRAGEPHRATGRARVEASRFGVRYSTEDSGDGSLEVIAENRAGVPFEEVELIVAYWDENQSTFVAYGDTTMWRDTINPHPGDAPMRSGPLPANLGWYWELYFVDIQGRHWRKRDCTWTTASPGCPAQGWVVRLENRRLGRYRKRSRRSRLAVAIRRERRRGRSHNPR